MTLHDFLAQSGWSVTELAIHLDYSREHISKIISGKNKPSAKLKRRIEQLLNSEEFKDASTKRTRTLQ